MNVWRWLGIAIFLLGTLSLIGATKLPVYAGGKEKDKTATDKDKDKDKDKAVVKDKDKDKDKGVVAKDKDKGKDKEKKEDTKPVVVPPKGAMSFDAFNTKKGAKKFYTEQYTYTNQKMKVMGQEVIQKQEQWFMIEWTPKDVDSKDNYEVVQKIVGVKMSIDIGGNKIAYNSVEGTKQKNPMTDFFDQLTNPKSELTYTIKSDLSSVVSVGGRDKFISGLSEINPQMQKLLQAILSDKALQKMAEPTWYAFPPNGVIPESKTWPRTSELDLGPIGSYKTEFKFTHLSDKKTAADEVAIGIATKLTYTAPTDKAGLPFIIHSATLKTEGGTGEAIFDRTKGRFKSTEINMNLSGELEIEVGSMKTKVDLNQEQKAKSTTYDELPKAWQSAAAK